MGREDRGLITVSHHKIVRKRLGYASIQIALDTCSHVLPQDFKKQQLIDLTIYSVRN